MKTTLKFIIIAFAAFAFTMCNAKQKDNSKNTSQETENFDWLLGKWKRTNEVKGKDTFENWEKINNSEYLGIGFTIQNKDTLSQEKMKILKTNGKWSLFVKVPTEKEFLEFEMSAIDNLKFESKNDNLDFPKLIRYWKNGNKINALVAGDSLKLSFEFERIE